MKIINIKYLWNGFSTFLLIGIFLLFSSGSFAESDKNDSVNNKKDMTQADNVNNTIESDDPAGPRDRDPSEIVLPSDNDSGNVVNKQNNESSHEYRDKNP